MGFGEDLARVFNKRILVQYVGNIVLAPPRNCGKKKKEPQISQTFFSIHFFFQIVLEIGSNNIPLSRI